MPNNPKSVGGHFEAVIGGWDEHAADATFGGLTLAQYKAKVKPSLDARDVIEDLERKLDAARVERNNADVVSSELTDNVVDSVKGDPNHGGNSPLYASLGYIRKDDRKSSLTRAAKKAALQPELKIAA